MAIAHAYAYAELKDGTTFEGVRVTLPTKIQFERTARANRWDPDNMPFTTGAFWAWHAGRLAGKLPQELTWDQFLEHIVDAGVTQTASADGTDQVDDEDPTERAVGTE